MNSFAENAESAATETKPATIVGSKTAISGGESIVSMVLSLILVMAIIFLLAWAAKRYGGTAFRSNASLRIMGGLSMGARERVVLVQVGEQQLLLGVSPGRVQTLHVLEKPIENLESQQGSGQFAERLKSIMNKGQSS